MQTKKIHIAIDGNEANSTQRVGSNIYAFEILKHLEEITRTNQAISWTVLLSTPHVADLPKERSGWEYKIISPKPFWTQWALPLHLYSHKHTYDLLYTPGHYAPRFSPIPYISSVMDVAFLEYPSYFKKEDLIKLRNWTKYSVQHAKKVIVISEFTKQEVIKQYKKAEQDVIIAHPAVYPPKKIPSKQTIASVTKKHSIYGPYFLFVGTIQPRKNIENLVSALELLHKRKVITVKPELVLAGKVGWLAEPILGRIKNSPANKYIHSTGYIKDTEKDALLAGAESVCLLGLYEGFGIPALEALHLGSVPIVSNTTSLPEVVGFAGITVDPTNTAAIADAMSSILTMKNTKRAQLRKEAREQVKKFTWKKSAAIVLDTILNTIP